MKSIIRNLAYVASLFLYAACGRGELALVGELDLGAALGSLSTTSSILEQDGYFVWGGSPVKGDDGKYHLYYSRWDKKYGFEAWASHSEVAHAVSDTPIGPYKFSDLALPPRYGDFWDGYATHNPTVKEFDGKYYLYYTGTTGDGVYGRGLNFSHRNRQQVGVAVAESPYGPWTRFDEPIVAKSSDNDALDVLLVSNPTITKTPEGKYLLLYKAGANKNPPPYSGPITHLTAISDTPVGPFAKQNKEVFTKENVDFPAEDPYMWYQDNCYYAIVKDNHGYFHSEKGVSALVLFYSEDGLDWKPANNIMVSKKQLVTESGDTLKFSNLERPQLLFEDGVPVALFCAVSYQYGVHSFNVHVPLNFKK